MGSQLSLEQRHAHCAGALPSAKAMRRLQQEGKKTAVERRRRSELSLSAFWLVRNLFGPGAVDPHGASLAQRGIAGREVPLLFSRSFGVSGSAVSFDAPVRRSRRYQESAVADARGAKAQPL